MRRTPLFALLALSVATSAFGFVACSSDDAASPSSLDSGGGGEPGPDGSTTPPGSDGSTPTPSNDGGGGEGAAPDGGRDLSTDRSLFFGASRCATSGLAFCEDFEGAAVDATKWTPTGTAPTIDAAQHARGAKALHVSINGNGASYLKTKKPFPAPKNRYWGRAFVRFEKMPGPPMTYSHWTFAAATGTGVAGEIRLGGQFQNGKNLFGIGTDNRTDAGTGDWTNSDKDAPPGGSGPRTVPTAEWMCIEWLHAGDTNETKFFWDAADHPSLATTLTKHGGNTNPYKLPTFDTVWVGWQEYQESTLPFELWVDEVAFDPERIGCVL